MKKALVFAILAALAAPLSAQVTTMTQIFKVDAGGSLSWFVNGDLTRGMAFNPSTGHLLVASRQGANNVYILDAATGAQLGQLDMTGVSGGNHVVSKVAVDSTGVIYVCNLGVATADFKIYRFANEAAAPTVAAETNPSPARRGDCISVTGTGTSTKLIVEGFKAFSGDTTTWTTADGLTFTPTVITPAIESSNHYAQWDTDGSSYWINKLASDMDAATSPALFNSSSALVRQEGLTEGAWGGFSVATMTIDSVSQKVMALTPGAIGAGRITASNGAIYTIQPTSGHKYVFTSAGLEPAAGANANGNGTGDACIDVTGRKVYYLYTNNSISGWNIPTTSGVADWTIY